MDDHTLPGAGCDLAADFIPHPVAFQHDDPDPNPNPHYLPNGHSNSHPDCLAHQDPNSDPNADSNSEPDALDDANAHRLLHFKSTSERHTLTYPAHSAD